MALRTRHLLYLTLAAFAIGIIAIRGTFLTIERRDAISRAEDASRAMAAIVEEYTRRTLDIGDIVAEEVADAMIRRGNLDRLATDYTVYRMLSRLASRLPASGSIWIVGADGRSVASSGRFPAPIVDHTDHPWWNAIAYEGRDSHVSEAMMSSLEREFHYIYARRIEDAAGRLLGVVQLSLKPAFFGSLRFSGELEEDATVGIYRTDGRLVARLPMSADMLARDYTDAALLTESLARPLGTYRAESAVDGIERIVSYRRLGDWPVIVFAAVSVDAALASWHRNMVGSVLALASMLVGLGLLTWLGDRAHRREETARAALEQTNCRLEEANRRLASALADKDVLFREVHHRVKNNLQVTGNLLLMQASKFTDPAVRAAFTETMNRLHSVGLVHETLYRTDKAAVIDLRDYVVRLVEGLSATYAAEERGICVDIDVEPFRLDLERAIPVALTLTEVLTNAFKHAFPDDAGGEISVSIRPRSDTVGVVVRDNGRGLPGDMDDGESMGMLLIGAFANQIGASFRFEGRNGTVFRMEFPAQR